MNPIYVFKETMSYWGTSDTHTSNTEYAYEIFDGKGKPVDKIVAAYERKEPPYPSKPGQIWTLVGPIIKEKRTEYQEGAFTICIGEIEFRIVAPTGMESFFSFGIGTTGIMGAMRFLESAKESRDFRQHELELTTAIYRLQELSYHYQPK